MQMPLIVYQYLQRHSLLLISVLHNLFSLQEKKYSDICNTIDRIILMNFTWLISSGIYYHNHQLWQTDVNKRLTNKLILFKIRIGIVAYLWLNWIIINEFQACYTGIRIVGSYIRHVFGCYDERVSPWNIFKFVYIYNKKIYMLCKNNSLRLQSTN